MKDFDLEKFAQMFDAALVSNNPTVKKALQNFMMVAAIVHAQEPVVGPLESLIRRVDMLERTVQDINSQKQYQDYKTIYTTSGIWQSTNTSGTSVTSDSINSMLKDLKFT